MSDANFTKEVVEAILEKAGAIAKNETIIGDPITFKDLLVVPVIKLSIGFGAAGGSGADGGGKASGSGGGAGGGVKMEPVCFLIHDGTTVRILPALPSKAKGMDSLVEKLPDMLTYAMDSLRARGDQPSDGERSKKED